MKEAEARAGAEGGAGDAGGAVSNNEVSQREAARLSVEHEHLTAEVAQMKQFLEENKDKIAAASAADDNGNQRTAQEIEELEDQCL